MIEIETLWPCDLRRGSTDHPRNGSCLMDAANWVAYGVIGDNPASACPVIRAYAIGLNDMLPEDQRQRLKPFILRVVDNHDPDSERARAEYRRAGQCAPAERAGPDGARTEGTGGCPGASAI